MKLLLSIFLFLVFLVINAQNTYVPDDNFENYLETHDQWGDTVPLGDPNSMGDGINYNDNVLTARIQNVWFLQIVAKNITDLTGLESFVSLDLLNCSGNPITEIDLTPFSNLYEFACQGTPITSLDVSSNPSLRHLYLSNGQITQLDLSANIIYELYGGNGVFETIDLRNGYNTSVWDVYLTNNPNLTCVFVDDAEYSEENWTNIDSHTHFVETQGECDSISVLEFEHDMDIILYPNPAIDHINIQLPDNEVPQYIHIINLLGEEVTKIMNSKRVEVSDLNSGMYIFQIKSKKRYIEKKFVIK